MATTLLQALGELLRPELVQPGPILLTEDDPGSTCKAISLHKSGQAFVLQPDRAAGGICPRNDCARTLSAPDRLFPLFRQGVPRLTAMCDYIVFCQESAGDDARLFVLLCELKSGNVTGSRQQVENGRLLADYILSMAMHHGPVRIAPRVERRGLVFSPRYNVPKGNLRKVRCAYELQPGGFQDLPFAYYEAGKDYPLSHFCV